MKKNESGMQAAGKEKRTKGKEKNEEKEEEYKGEKGGQEERVRMGDEGEGWEGESE